MSQDNRTDDFGLPRLRAWLLGFMLAVAAGVVGGIAPAVGGGIGLVMAGAGVAILLGITKVRCRTNGLAYLVLGLVPMALLVAAPNGNGE